MNHTTSLTNRLRLLDILSTCSSFNDDQVTFLEDLVIDEEVPETHRLQALQILDKYVYDVDPTHRDEDSPTWRTHYGEGGYNSEELAIAAHDIRFDRDHG